MSLEEQFRQHELQDLDRHAQIVRELGGISKTLEYIAKRLDGTDQDVEEITGSRIVSATSDSKFWRNLFIGVMAALGTTGLGALVTWLLMKGH